MAKLFKFEVVTPTRVFFRDEVEFILFETPTGEMGVMANHVPMLVANKACALKIKVKGEEKYAFISEGFIEITSEKVTSIVDEAEWIDEIDVKKAENDLKSAEDDLLDKKEDFEMKAELVASIERSMAKMKTVTKYK